MTAEFIGKVFKDFHSGKPFTPGRKYNYTVEYNGRERMAWRMIRAAADGSTSWEDIGAMPANMQFIPRNSCIQTLTAKKN